MARRAADEGLSVRALEARARAAPKRARASAARRPRNDDDVRRTAALSLRDAGGRRRAERGGTIEIRFADEADLLRIVDLLLGERRERAHVRVVETMPRRERAFLLAIAMLGAASPPPYGPVPKNAQTAVVTKYVEALRAAKYDDAYALLSDEEREYYRSSAADYRSVFAADGYASRRALAGAAQQSPRQRVLRARAHTVRRSSADNRARDRRDVPLGVLPSTARCTSRIRQAVSRLRSTSTADASGLRVTVKKVEFWPDRIDVVMTFANAVRAS